MNTMTAKDVAVLVAMAKSTKARTRREAWWAQEAATRRLRQHAAGELALAPEVRLPLDAVVGQLWKLRKAALAQWRVAKAAEAAAAAAPVESTVGAPPEDRNLWLVRMEQAFAEFMAD